MYFVNNLTDDDFQWVHDTCPDPPPAMFLAGSFAALLEAIDIYTHEAVHPVTSGMLAHRQGEGHSRSVLLMRRSAGHASHSKRSVDLTGL
jgi:hypothetical protein